MAKIIKLDPIFHGTRESLPNIEVLKKLENELKELDEMIGETLQKSQV